MSMCAESGEGEGGSEENEGLRMAVKATADEERCIRTSQQNDCPTGRVLLIVRG
jgi:hypothetical protein